ncbi:hypothetical protein V6N13_110764 [Hibiscus sabdariffa]|uniref:Uncharacterized protein n=1 Tax=Hibiscus sabdariffa TaxID=183260 RepID=A0ABR2TI62_9ROSI
MAETKSPHEPALPSQAKEGFQSAEDRTHETSGNDDSSVPERQFGNEEPGVDAGEEDEDGGDHEEDENGNAAVDWKGKGILVC